MVRTTILSVLCTFLISTPSTLIAHSGGLDANGGHHDRKRGGYHYHNRAKASPKSSYQPKSYSYSTPTATVNKYSVSPKNSYQHKSYNYSAPKNTVKKAPNHKNKIHSVRIVGYSDGDTITVIKDGKQIKIRLYGIDCPEKKQPWGKKATWALKHILKGREIKIKIMDKDRYGRTVAIVYANGKSANEIMVKAGFAWIYPRYCKDPICRQWKFSEQEAKRHKRGLWKDASSVPPWEWRKKLSSTFTQKEAKSTLEII